MRHPITVGEMVEILRGFPQDLPVHMSMNMEYQSRVCTNMVELFTRDDGSQYLLVTDTPRSEWDEDLAAGEDFADGWDGQPDEAQEWHDYDPDC